MAEAAGLGGSAGAQLTPQEKIEEAHGLWELAVVRLATMAEVGVTHPLLRAAVDEERAAFAHWQAVSNAATRSL